MLLVVILLVNETTTTSFPGPLFFYSLSFLALPGTGRRVILATRFTHEALPKMLLVNTADCSADVKFEMKGG